MSSLRLAAIGLALAAGLVSTRPAAQAVSSVAWLDRYARGEFEPIARELHDFTDFDALLKDLKDRGPAWIEAGGPAEQAWIRAKTRLDAVRQAAETNAPEQQRQRARDRHSARLAQMERQLVQAASLYGLDGAMADRIKVHQATERQGREGR